MPVLFTDTNGISFDGDRSSRVISIPTEAALNIFQQYVVRRPSLSENLFGLYSFVRPAMGEPRRVRFGSFSTPRHLLQKANGCGWNPKGKVVLSTESHDLGSVDYDGEQCPDAFGQCLDGIFGFGNQQKNMFGTPEGRALFDELLSKIYTGLGNSFWDLLHFANHPVITEADTGGWYNVDADEWADYTDQQINADVGGLITILDQLKDVNGLPQLQVAIQSSDISANGKDFVGDVIALFQALVEAARPDFEVMIDEVRGGQGAPVMLVSKSVFKAYKDYLVSTYAADHMKMFQLFYEGNDGMTYPVRNVLQWDGIWIVQAGAWATFDAINGVTTHRAILTAPGNLGVGYDAEAVLSGQFRGLGLVVNQWLQPPYKGQVYMTTRFGLTGAIVDPDFLTMGCYIAKPA